jgi:hypothetical protein
MCVVCTYQYSIVCAVHVLRKLSHDSPVCRDVREWRKRKEVDYGMH